VDEHGLDEQREVAGAVGVDVVLPPTRPAAAPTTTPEIIRNPPTSSAALGDGAWVLPEPPRGR
jgi:hypothetical protein